MLSEVSNDRIAFGDFLLEPRERRLTRSGEPVELNARYLDALLLLAGHPGELITKDRFLDQVWNGVPVTDEALTQCVRSLRRALGDDASRPRFIETVPRHGYRFIGAVEDGTALSPPSPAAEAHVTDPPADVTSRTGRSQGSTLLITGASLAGGAVAGLIGGIGYGLLAATDPPAGTGAISVVLVMTCLCLMVGMLGGTGVGAGVALARQLLGQRLLPSMVGGALGGLVIGALGRLIGLDAFALLIGTRPIAITGGSEGLVIGAVAGAAAWLALRESSTVERSGLAGAALGTVAGLLVALGGGQMMAGSLAVLAAAHPQAPLGALIGSPLLPLWARLATSAVEGATFVAALGVALTLACRSSAQVPRR